MSRRSVRRAPRTALLLSLLAVAGSTGCWEQWSESWWPQMKYQKAVQAYEELDWNGRLSGFMPPEGSVPVDGGEAPVSNVIDAEADVLRNPRPMSLESLERGREQYAIFCSPCHGESGLGNGTVSMTGPIQGPLAGVLPLAGPASIARVRSDGHIYTTIRYGRRRMPGYGRIASQDRWDIVNWVRYLNEKEVAP